MGKLSYNNKLRTQTLREQRFGAKAIISSYPDKALKLSTVKKDCSRFDQTGSAILHKPDSGRPGIWVHNLSSQDNFPIDRPYQALKQCQ